MSNTAGAPFPRGRSQAALRGCPRAVCGRAPAQASIDMGLQRFTSHSATLPQLKQMNRGARAMSLISWNCPLLASTQRWPSCSPLHDASFMMAHYTRPLSKSQADC